MTSPRVLAVIQARMASARLPGKSLCPLAGRPVLDWVCARVRRARRVDAIILTTGDGAEDDVIAARGAALGLPVVRGPVEDVLGRFLACLDHTPADICLRVTGDNPLTAPELIDGVTGLMLDGDLDYAYAAPAPYGAGADAVRAERLRAVGAVATRARHREHINTFFLDNHLFFRIGAVRPAVAAGPELRLTLDTATDLERLEALYQRLDDPLAADLAEIAAAYATLPPTLRAWDAPLPPATRRSCPRPPSTSGH